MNCKQAKAEIALWVGNDLDESAERSLRRHLSQCPDCRKHWKRMKATLRMLQAADEVPSATSDASLWPRLSAALSAAEQQDTRRSRFNGWVPALAVAAGCLAMISLSSGTPSVERLSDSPGLPVQSAVHMEMPWRPAALTDKLLDVEADDPSRSPEWVPHDTRDDRSSASLEKEKAKLRLPF